MLKQFFRAQPAGIFQPRSAERDRSNDQAALASIDAAIVAVLAKSTAERDGLKRRIDDVISRAAIVGGNGGDEHLSRNPDQTDLLRQSDADIRQGHQRLRQLNENIAHFERVRTALHSGRITLD